MNEAFESGYHPSAPELTPPGFAVEEIIIAGDRGPCGGVNMAVETTFEVLGIVAGREDVYANNDPVHNRLLTKIFEDSGLKVQKNINEIPNGSILIASAHGWSPKDQELARNKNLLVIDVTCQLVEMVGRAAERAVGEGEHVLYIGDKDHPEPKGILGRLPDDSYTFIDINDPDPKFESEILDVLSREIDPMKLAVLNQTTLSTKGVMKKVEALRKIYPELKISDPDGICYATDNRQKAVRNRLFNKEEPIDALFAVGSPDLSHNSEELKNIGREREKIEDEEERVEIEERNERYDINIPSHLIDRPEEIDQQWFGPNIKRVMLTSGASVLDPYFLRVVEYFTSRGARIKFLPSEEKKPVIDPDTKRPIVNSDTGEIVYEERFFTAPNIDLLWKRMKDKYQDSAN